MTIKEAVVVRFVEICRERSISYNELATLSGVTPSTVYTLLDAKRHGATISTIAVLCSGLGISLSEFFDSDYFKDLDID